MYLGPAHCVASFFASDKGETSKGECELNRWGDRIGHLNGILVSIRESMEKGDSEHEEYQEEEEESEGQVDPRHLHKRTRVEERPPTPVEEQEIAEILGGSTPRSPKRRRLGSTSSAAAPPPAYSSGRAQQLLQETRRLIAETMQKQSGSGWDPDTIEFFDELVRRRITGDPRYAFWTHVIGSTLGRASEIDPLYVMDTNGLGNVRKRFRMGLAELAEMKDKLAEFKEHADEMVLAPALHRADLSQQRTQIERGFVARARELQAARARLEIRRDEPSGLPEEEEGDWRTHPSRFKNRITPRVVVQGRCRMAEGRS